MEDYERLEKKCNEDKMYAKRVMDLYCDGKKWKWLANAVDSEEEKEKYMLVSDNLMELFYKEIDNMKL